MAATGRGNLSPPKLPLTRGQFALACSPHALQSALRPPGGALGAWPAASSGSSHLREKSSRPGPRGRGSGRGGTEGSDSTRQLATVTLGCSLHALQSALRPHGEAARGAVLQHALAHLTRVEEGQASLLVLQQALGRPVRVHEGLAGPRAAGAPGPAAPGAVTPPPLPAPSLGGPLALLPLQAPRLQPSQPGADSSAPTPRGLPASASAGSGEGRAGETPRPRCHHQRQVGLLRLPVEC